MAYAGLVKRAKSHFENCNNGTEETPVQGDCSSARRPPRGPNVKKNMTSMPMETSDKCLVRSAMKVATRSNEQSGLEMYNKVYFVFRIPCYAKTVV